jgi:acyl carrier protein phosphodiesterase
MNLLAHAYLSFNQPSLLVGNMISDYVKGSSKLLYPPAIQRGINLHRAIDAFTDQHEATKEAKQFFRPHYRLYAGACIDVVYDHFLANDSSQFETEAALNAFAQTTYQQLGAYKMYMPEKFLTMLPYMQSQNWLYHYRFKYGIERSFGGLVRRAAYLTDSATAFAIFQEQYDQLQQCYRHFFPELKQMAVEWLLQPAAE